MSRRNESAANRPSRPCVAAVGLVLLVMLALLPAPDAAHAVVGGDPARNVTLKAVVNLDGCTGTLVAVDQVLTAAHCVGNLSELPTILGRRAIRASIHPRYTDSSTRRSYRHGDERGDLALLGLNEPLRGVKPLAVIGAGDRSATRPGDRVHLVGFGFTRYRRAEPGGRRRVALRVLPDTRCDTVWRARGGEFQRAWEPRSMFCTRDADGLKPFRAACNGDSGAPLLVRRREKWVVVGVESWGRQCGQAGDPGVATQLPDPFLARRAPVWAPAPLPGDVRIDGNPEVGATLTCVTPGWTEKPERVEYRWLVNRAGGQVVTEQPQYVVPEADRGRVVSCVAIASNDGGRAQSPVSARAHVR